MHTPALNRPPGIPEASSAVRQWRRLLKPSGILAVSELTWLIASRPAELKDHWHAQYAEVGTTSSKLAVLERNGYAPIRYFTLGEHGLSAPRAQKPAQAHDAATHGRLLLCGCAETACAAWVERALPAGHRWLLGRRHGVSPTTHWTMALNKASRGYARPVLSERTKTLGCRSRGSATSQWSARASARSAPRGRIASLASS